MADVVVTVPRNRWQQWVEEGSLPGEGDSDEEYAFWLYGVPPDIQIGELVYIVAHGKLRGYAPLIRIEQHGSQFGLIRGGGAVACTIEQPITGFRGWRYRDWDRADERAFPDWRTP